MILLWDSSDMTVRMSLLEGETRHDYEWQAGRDLARYMLAYLRDRLAEHGKVLADVHQIGVFRGPGSYTGLRIGLTVLNTLASAQGSAIVGAVGSGWQAECLARLQAGSDDKLVLPEYGGNAHTTKPRK